MSIVQRQHARGGFISFHFLTVICPYVIVYNIREIGETDNDFNDRLIRRAVNLFQVALTDATDCKAILLSNDAANRVGTVLSLRFIHLIIHSCIVRQRRNSRNAKALHP